MSLIDMFKEFHHTAIQQEFPPSARCLFDTFLYKFNEAFWIDSLVLSERDLIRLTGLKKTTLHEAIHFLTSRYIIERKPFKNKFMFSFGDEMTRLLLKGQTLIERPVADQLPTINRPLSDQSPTGLARSQIRAREDVKTLDVKTLSKEKQTRARDTSEDIDILVDEWQEAGGARLNQRLIAKLNALLKENKLSDLLAALELANGGANNPNFGFSFDYFKLKLSELKEGKTPKKGGEKRGKTGELHYDEPDPDVVYPWDAPEYANRFGAEEGTA